MDFKIFETEIFISKIKKEPFRSIRKKINEYVYPQLISNPFCGSNIKKLKGKYEGVYRYRIGKFRLFYTIENTLLKVIAFNIEQRKNSY